MYIYIYIYIYIYFISRPYYQLSTYLTFSLVLSIPIMDKGGGSMTLIIFVITQHR